MRVVPTLNNDPVVLAQPDKKRTYNKVLFSEVSRRYFFATRILSLFRDNAWKRFTVKRLPVTINGTVLDIATGTGDIATLAAQRWPGCPIIGCDLSLDMMSYIPKLAGRKILLCSQDMTTLGIRSSSISVITAGYALRNAPDLHCTIAECFRALKPGGSAAFLDFSRSPNTILFWFQYRVLRFWGGLWGLILHGNPAVYAYLAESLRLFPDRNTLNFMLIQAGFDNVTSYRRMFGLIEIIIAQKAIKQDFSSLK